MVRWGALEEVFLHPQGATLVSSPLPTVPQKWVLHDRFPERSEESSRLRPPERAAAAFLALAS